MADVDELLYARAVVRGLERDPLGWSRPGNPKRLVARANDGRWWWAPESWRWDDVLRHGFWLATEAEALSEACDWMDEGEAELVPGET